VHDLPGLPGNWVGQDVFGAYASTFWLDAYGPALASGWSWPSAADVTGRPVPDVVGERRSTATADLLAAGFRVAIFPGRCGSDRPSGSVAYQQPPRAPRGAVVTICLSSASTPYVYVPPAPPLTSQPVTTPQQFPQSSAAQPSQSAQNPPSNPASSPPSNPGLPRPTPQSNPPPNPPPTPPPIPKPPKPPKPKFSPSGQ
jgi:hypothetical protein